MLWALACSCPAATVASFGRSATAIGSTAQPAAIHSPLSSLTTLRWMARRRPVTRRRRRRDTSHCHWATKEPWRPLCAASLWPNDNVGERCTQRASDSTSTPQRHHAHTHTTIRQSNMHSKHISMILAPGLTAHSPRSRLQLRCIQPPPGRHRHCSAAHQHLQPHPLIHLRRSSALHCSSHWHCDRDRGHCCSPSRRLRPPPFALGHPSTLTTGRCRSVHVRLQR